MVETFTLRNNAYSTMQILFSGLTVNFTAQCDYTLTRDPAGPIIPVVPTSPVAPLNGNKQN